MSGESKTSLRQMEASRLGTPFRRRNDSKLLNEPLRASECETYQDYLENCKLTGRAKPLTEPFFNAVKARSE